jgi:hypothetical protein
LVRGGFVTIQSLSAATMSKANGSDIQETNVPGVNEKGSNIYSSTLRM